MSNEKIADKQKEIKNKRKSKFSLVKYFFLFFSNIIKINRINPKPLANPCVAFGPMKAHLKDSKYVIEKIMKERRIKIDPKFFLIKRSENKLFKKDSCWYFFDLTRYRIP